MLIDTARK